MSSSGVRDASSILSQICPMKFIRNHLNLADTSTNGKHEVTTCKA